MASFLSKIKALCLKPPIVLTFIMLIGLGIRLLVTPLRWINPDEGAHLMDARLLLQGMIPVVEFASRQPLYTLLLAGLLKVFGLTLWAGRLLPIFSCLGIGWMIFLIGRRLFDDATALLAAAIHLFLPYTIIWSTVVKSEMPAVLLCCIAVYLLILALQNRKNDDVYMVLSGTIAALAFYVRQTAIYLPAAVFLFLLFFPVEHRSWRWRRIGLFFAGYVAICLLVGVLYWRPMGLRSLLLSQLNPLHLIFSRVGQFLGILPVELRVVDSEGYRILEQDAAYTLQSWRDGVLFAAFIVAAAFLSIWRWLRSYDQQRSNQAILIVLLNLWPLLAFLAYVYQSIQSVFYSQYFLEVIPYLTILAAEQIIYVCKRKSVAWWKILSLAAFLFYLIFLLMRYFWHWQWPVAGHISLAVILTSIFVILTLWKKEQPSTFVFLMAAVWVVASAWGGHFLRLEPLLYTAIAVGGMILLLNHQLQTPTLVSFLLVTFFWLLTAAYSGSRIGPKYEAVWSPSTLKQVTRILTSQREPSDTVLSGAMIWTFSSGLQPYGGVTHPTVFLKKMDENFERTFQQRRPTFIVIDGHTEKKFARHWSFIRDEIEANYYLLAQVKGSKYPVLIFRCNQPPFSDVPFLAALTFDGRGTL